MDKELCQKNVVMLSSSVKTKENRSQTKVSERLVQKSFKNKQAVAKHSQSSG